MQEIRDMEKMAEFNALKCAAESPTADVIDQLKRAEAVSAEIIAELKRAQDEKIKQQVDQQVNELMKHISAPGRVGLTPSAPVLVTDGIGRLMWTISCVTEELRRVVNHLPTTEQNEHARLALRHLEDAHHRLDLAAPRPPL